LWKPGATKHQGGGLHALPVARRVDAYVDLKSAVLVFEQRTVTGDVPMITRMVVQTAIGLTVMGCILFLAAGDWSWPQGWVFLGEVGVSIYALNVWLARHDPALLATRLSSPVQPDQRPWDRVFLAAGALVFISWLVLSAFDARRFGWSRVPVWAEALGAVLIALCMFVVWQAFRFNTFAAPQVRMQTDREQRVISDGPYGVVRHPMYAGGLLMFVGMPLLLGSWWGLLFVPLAVGGIGLRAGGGRTHVAERVGGLRRLLAACPVQDGSWTVVIVGAATAARPHGFSPAPPQRRGPVRNDTQPRAAPAWRST
jgi:protein-S-isoprenylcysteine O-methyltransferase Ste14